MLAPVDAQASRPVRGARSGVHPKPVAVDADHPPSPMPKEEAPPARNLLQSGGGQETSEDAGATEEAVAVVESATSALKNFDTGGDAETDIDEMLDEWTWVTRDIEEGRKQFETTYPRLPEALTELQAIDSQAAQGQARLTKLRDELSGKAEALLKKARGKKDEEQAIQIEGELSEGRKWTGALEEAIKSHRADVASSVKDLQAWQKDEKQHASEAVGMSNEVDDAVKDVHQKASDPNAGPWREEARGRLNNLLEVSDEYKNLAAKCAEDVTVAYERIDSLRDDLYSLEEQANEWQGQIEEREKGAAE